MCIDFYSLIYSRTHFRYGRGGGLREGEGVLKVVNIVFFLRINFYNLPPPPLPSPFTLPSVRHCVHFELVSGINQVFCGGGGILDFRRHRQIHPGWGEGKKR